MYFICAFIFIGLFNFSTVSCRLFYRRDYIYGDDFDAFYKMHPETGSWASAFLQCETEGASLLYPKSVKELELIRGMRENMYQNITDMFVGLHDEFDIGEYMTIDGHTTPMPIEVTDDPKDNKKCITVNLDTGNYQTESCSRVPSGAIGFVCKRTVHQSCPTIDKGYTYDKATNYCYKFNVRPATWEGAMKTCYMEGGTLASPSNQEKVSAMEAKRKSGYDLYYVGVRKQFGKKYYTVKGEVFEENERNDNDMQYQEPSERQDCGAYNSNRKIRHVNCEEKLPFICEIEAK